MPSVSFSVEKQASSCMSKQESIAFGRLSTRSSIVWDVGKFRLWKWRDRSMESVMQRFVALNRHNFQFLGINAVVETRNCKPFVVLTTSNYAGVIPLFSPMSGKPAGDLVVGGSYGEKIDDLIPLLGDSVGKESNDTLHLVNDTPVTAPIYVECCKYVDLYLEARRQHWHKFANVIKKQHRPSSATLWTEYALRTEVDPTQKLVFNNKCIILTTDHIEWRELNYVLSLALHELQSTEVPLSTRMIYASKVNSLLITLRNSELVKTGLLPVRAHDPVPIKNLKRLGNLILENKGQEKLAWRMDYAQFFERYVQYLLRDVVTRKGGVAMSNPHYDAGMGQRPQWGLAYIEPDAVLQKGNVQWVIDAKYKSHIYNWYDSGEALKDAFRHDLHQVLAYCSFNSMADKRAALIYPYSIFTAHRMKIFSSITRSKASVYLVGIPIDRSMVASIESHLTQLIDFSS